MYLICKRTHNVYFPKNKRFEQVLTAGKKYELLKKPANNLAFAIIDDTNTERYYYWSNMDSLIKINSYKEYFYSKEEMIKWKLNNLLYRNF